MSPTEGLIYKPYGGPDHTGSNPTMCNFSNTPYSMPNSHPFFQGFRVPPNFPSMTHHGYFPQYRMPYMGTKFNEQQENLCMNNSISNVQNFVKTQMGRERELQVSTASSPEEGRNGLSLFLNPHDNDVANENLTRAIKVVPHNAVTANESAFRIFQCIQKEREQYESA